MSVAALDKLVSGFLQDQEADRPDILWHYTNATGFLGIFRSGKLWATNTDYLLHLLDALHACCNSTTLPDKSKKKCCICSMHFTPVATPPVKTSYHQQYTKTFPRIA